MRMIPGVVPADQLQELSERSRTCIARLSHHQRSEIDLSDQPTSKLAAVLVLLYEKSGKLRVLLTTRSKRLRSHPGQTALPGGRVEETDGDVFKTAHREAYEEVGIPLKSPYIHDVCVLEPFFSSSRLLVIPIVALLTDPTILDSLQPSEQEVAHIFDHPLEAILDPTLAEAEPLVPVGSEHWPYQTTYHNTTDIVWGSLGGMAYRMHRFRSSASPIKGLTADILIKTAQMAYGSPPVYERFALNQAQDFMAACRLAGIDEQTQVQVGLAMADAGVVPVPTG